MGVSKAGEKKEQEVYSDLDIAGCYEVQVPLISLWIIALVISGHLYSLKHIYTSCDYWKNLS